MTKCPYYVDRATTGTHPQCWGVVVPFEPSSLEQRQFCSSGLHRHCPLYRQANRDLTLAIHREVERAIG